MIGETSEADGSQLRLLLLQLLPPVIVSTNSTTATGNGIAMPCGYYLDPLLSQATRDFRLRAVCFDIPTTHYLSLTALTMSLTISHVATGLRVETRSLRDCIHRIVKHTSKLSACTGSLFALDSCSRICRTVRSGECVSTQLNCFLTAPEASRFCSSPS